MSRQISKERVKIVECGHYRGVRIGWAWRMTLGLLIGLVDYLTSIICMYNFHKINTKQQQKQKGDKKMQCDLALCFGPSLLSRLVGRWHQRGDHLQGAWGSPTEASPATSGQQQPTVILVLLRSLLKGASWPWIKHSGHSPSRGHPRGGRQRTNTKKDFVWVEGTGHRQKSALRLTPCYPGPQDPGK